MWAAHRLEGKHEVVGRCSSTHDSYLLVLHTLCMKWYPAPQNTSSFYFLELQHYPTLLFNLQYHHLKSGPDIFYKFIKEIEDISSCFIDPCSLSCQQLACCKVAQCINVSPTFCQCLLILFKFNATLVLEIPQVANTSNTTYLFYATN